jgi:hypothetical protein
MASPSDVRATQLTDLDSKKEFTLKNPTRLAGAFAGGPEPTILRTAPAIAFLIRRFEYRYVKSCAAGAVSSHSVRFCSPAEKLRWLPIVAHFGWLP